MSRIFRTKSGRVLSDQEIEDLADEAEAGYYQDKDGKWHPIRPAPDRTDPDRPETAT